MAERTGPLLAQDKLAFLLSRRHCDVFCLNDTDSAAVALDEQAAMMADFLPKYFPFRSPFELDIPQLKGRAFRGTPMSKLTMRHYNLFVIY